MRDQFKKSGDVDVLRRQMMLGAAASVMLPWATPAQAAPAVEGVVLDEATTVGGHKMVLNGYGLRKRGYFKADVTALYLPKKMSSPEAIYKLDGPRRIQLNILREFTSSTITRIFLADFKQSATEEEFKRLIGPIGQIGAAYADIKHVAKGDVVNVDWTPGVGWTAAHNGKQLMEGSAIKDELAFQIYLRMYIGPAAPEELRNGLLGTKA